MLTAFWAPWYRRRPRHWQIWRRTAWLERLPEGPEVPQLLNPPPGTQRRSRRDDVVIRAQSLGISSSLSLRETTPELVRYTDFLRGEAEIDDDEGEWQNEEDGESSGSDSQGEQELEQDLFRDFITSSNPEGGEDLQPVLLAHLTSNSSMPLTRRRYAAMMSTPTGVPRAQGIQDVLRERRAEVRPRERDAWDDDRRRLCVVCTIEPRDTILWPCRCLALCNECRESLASRLAANDHLCPCCRRRVEGYSRIYVP